MTETEFWALVTRSNGDQDQESLAATLTARLTPLDDEALKAFDKLFGQKMRQSYLWSLWGAAYVITGCDSEYAFAEFRSFLISLGQDWFQKAIAAPDCLAQLPLWPLKDGYPYPFVDEYDLIAGKLYEDRTGRELPFVPSGKATPAGKKFSTKKKDLKSHYPGLAARFPF
ncbi:DUF4240 domain-containing protein [Shewanella sp. AS16]|uniref:DUF4240 domain-containing protein n=1 Tax=Shewanella sp. AS16 TaxID=2907625 RepID=UPI001F2D4C76|nr:DUF4240 domain-containing protein [Shewanella sp. AS16]MCE9685864.1 DUF4240 domain-containing protein [Shewanella sp. AS16]